MNPSKTCTMVFSLKDQLLPQYLHLQPALLQIPDDFFYLEKENSCGKKDKSSWRFSTSLYLHNIYNQCKLGVYLYFSCQLLIGQRWFWRMFHRNKEAARWIYGGCFSNLFSSVSWRKDLDFPQPLVITNSKIPPSSSSLIQSLHIRISVVSFQESICIKRVYVSFMRYLNMQNHIAKLRVKSRIRKSWQ